MEKSGRSKFFGRNVFLTFRLHLGVMTNAWPESVPAPSAAVTAALQHVRTTLAVAQGLAGTGRSIDLTGLDAAAGMLCAQVLDLPPSEGAALRPALTELEIRLSALACILGGSTG